MNCVYHPNSWSRSRLSRRAEETTFDPQHRPWFPPICTHPRILWSGKFHHYKYHGSSIDMLLVWNSIGVYTFARKEIIAHLKHINSFMGQLLIVSWVRPRTQALISSIHIAWKLPNLDTNCMYCYRTFVKYWGTTDSFTLWWWTKTNGLCWWLMHTAPSLIDIVGVWLLRLK